MLNSHIKKYTLIAATIMAVAGVQAQEQLLPIEPVNSGRISDSQADALLAELSGTDQVPALKQNNNAGAQATQNRLQRMDNPDAAAILEQYNSVMAAPVRENPIIAKAKKNYKPTQEYTLKPFDNILVPVGQGLMNSIATNFNMVAVRTSDKNAILEVVDGYIYATLNSNEPVGLIMYEEGVLSSQVSVTLIPIAAPPVIVDLTIDLTRKMKADAQAYLDKIQREKEDEVALEVADSYSSEHNKRIVELLKPVARGDLPRGFSLTNDTPNWLVKPCQTPIYQYAGQRLTGGKEVIDVVLLKNDTNRVYQVREEMCLSNDVIAVALFSKSYLEPGDETEMYILRNRHYTQERKREHRRPRLTTESN
ncbi:type-F conjugative transfer system secretin TraK [Colwellia sp. MSW7]|jgi:conjugal transfer pilus assembly protein TraK|uniref:Type-F conjugative transfer system secretin TraK n=1 Tax=Colwellia maritima TaxID=2912588 RepID=A0ABS9X766_9GAMM|nr:type-F conjugative transfer system secretin TraK [Colwellia maritima]MCI2286066.1 type-F conjugative transfer system secretin TraK [Colwellia maritima]